MFLVLPLNDATGRGLNPKCVWWAGSGYIYDHRLTKKYLLMRLSHFHSRALRHTVKLQADGVTITVNISRIVIATIIIIIMVILLLVHIHDQVHSSDNELVHVCSFFLLVFLYIFNTMCFYVNLLQSSASVTPLNNHRHT